MSTRVDDRWLWLGFGVFFFLAANGIRYAIKDIIQLTKADPDQYESQSKLTGEQPEDTISLENLQILAESPNSNISNSAISLILSRFARLPNATQLLTKDLNSKDENVRARARTAVEFLRAWGMPELARRTLPYACDAIPDSPSYSPPPGVRLTTAELARRLGEGVGGVTGGSGGVRWPGEVLVPSPQSPVAGWTNVPRERPLNGDDDELERRRRRREAMVLHEGAGAVREDDIIRPRG